MRVEQVNSVELPQMEVKWFKVIFDSEDWRTPKNMIDFSNYVIERRIFNGDAHQIDYWGPTNPTNETFHERILKTNSKMYFDELNEKYTLIEIEKPESIVDRQSNDEMVSIVNEAQADVTQVKVVPIRNPYYGVFTAKVERYDEAGAVFKKSDASINFPAGKQLIHIAYLNLFRLTNLV